MKAILTVAIQGAGKSTYAKKLESMNPEMKRATKDDIRFLLFDKNKYVEMFDTNYTLFGDLVNEIHKKVIETILAQNLTIIIDETHHTKRSRLKMIQFLRSINKDIEIEAHYLHCPLDVCLARNAQRSPEQIVPEYVVRTFYNELSESLNGFPSNVDIIQTFLDEGFNNAKIVYLDTLQNV